MRVDIGEASHPLPEIAPGTPVDVIICGTIRHASHSRSGGWQYRAQPRELSCPRERRVDESAFLTHVVQPLVANRLSVAVHLCVESDAAHSILACAVRAWAVPSAVHELFTDALMRLLVPEWRLTTSHPIHAPPVRQAFEADDQFSRLGKCFAAASMSRRRRHRGSPPPPGLYVRTRPDAYWFGAISLPALDVVSLRVRILRVSPGSPAWPDQGKKPVSLHRFHFASTCDVYRGPTECSIVDDQAAVVPQRHAKAYFLGKHGCGAEQKDTSTNSSQSLSCEWRAKGKNGGRVLPGETRGRKWSEAAFTDELRACGVPLLIFPFPVRLDRHSLPPELLPSPGGDPGGTGTGASTRDRCQKLSDTYGVDYGRSDYGQLREAVQAKAPLPPGETKRSLRMWWHDQGCRTSPQKGQAALVAANHSRPVERRTSHNEPPRAGNWTAAAASGGLRLLPKGLRVRVPAQLVALGDGC